MLISMKKSGKVIHVLSSINKFYENQYSSFFFNFHFVLDYRCSNLNLSDTGLFTTKCSNFISVYA